MVRNLASQPLPRTVFLVFEFLRIRVTDKSLSLKYAIIRALRATKVSVKTTEHKDRSNFGALFFFSSSFIQQPSTPPSSPLSTSGFPSRPSQLDIGSYSYRSSNHPGIPYPSSPPTRSLIQNATHRNHLRLPRHRRRQWR